MCFLCGINYQHHGYWVPCDSRLNCAGSRSWLEPQRYSVHDPSACGYALALTTQITCCLAGRCLQAKARRRELQNNDKGSITTLFDAMKRKLRPKYTEVNTLIYSKQCYIRNWSHGVD